VRIQIVSWRDPQSPKAGGAEVCLREISRRLIGQFGHEVAWFAPRFAGSAASEARRALSVAEGRSAGLARMRTASAQQRERSAHEERAHERAVRAGHDRSALAYFSS